MSYLQKNPSMQDIAKESAYENIDHERYQQILKDFKDGILNFDINTQNNKNDIISLQTKLVALGYKLKWANEGRDGFWGGSTQDALEHAQKVIPEYYASRTQVVTETRQETAELKKEIAFTRTLKRWVEGDDVKILQQYLTSKGYDTNGIDGKFGQGTQKALKAYQQKELWFSDGVMDLGGQTMAKITADLNLSPEAVKYGAATTEVVENLEITDIYLSAFNKIYGGTEDIISRHNGILWVINRYTRGSDLDLFVKELEQNLDAQKIDTIIKELSKEDLAEKLGLKETGEKYDAGLRRTIIIALASFIMSGGTTIGIELFAINYGDNYSAGPEVDGIVSTLKDQAINHKKKVQSMMLSEATTIEGLNKVVDISNNEAMDVNNIKRLCREIYQPNWFQRTFGIFLSDNYEEIHSLVEQFETIETTQEALDIVKQIYVLSYNMLVDAENNVEEKQELFDKYRNPKDFHHSEYDTDLDPVGFYNNGEYTHNELEKAKAEYKMAAKAFSNMGSLLGKYVNLDAKRGQIQGEKFDAEYALKREQEIDQSLGLSNFKKVQFLSKESFGFHVDQKEMKNDGYMEGIIKMMKEHSVDGKSSVLANVMRWVEQHYFGKLDEIFTPEEFIAALEKAEPASSDYILSNLGRRKNQKFQGTLKTSQWDGNLFKINLKGREIFFKDKCTNIVTVVNDVITTVNSTSSFPIVYPAKPGFKSGNSTWNINPDTTPGEEIVETGWNNVTNVANPINQWSGTTNIWTFWGPPGT